MQFELWQEVGPKRLTIQPTLHSPDTAWCRAFWLGLSAGVQNQNEFIGFKRVPKLVV